MALVSAENGDGAVEASPATGAPLRHKSLLLPTLDSTTTDVLLLTDRGLDDVPLTSRGPGTPRRILPWQVLFLQRNRLMRVDGLIDCAKLIKLDLSFNNLENLPNRRIWVALPKLQTLLLHHNNISAIDMLPEMVPMHIDVPPSLMLPFLGCTCVALC